MALLVLLVGLPGAGKTTVARRLAGKHSGLRLTPDEWMIPLFGDSDANGNRDVLEGRMITLELLRRLVAAAPPLRRTTWPEWAQDRWPSISID